MSTKRTRGKRTRDSATYLDAKEVDRIRRGCMEGGEYHAKPLYSIGRLFGVGAGEIRKAVEGSGHYNGLPGISVPSVKLAALENAAIPVGPTGEPLSKRLLELTKQQEVEVVKKPHFLTHQEAVRLRYLHFREKWSIRELMVEFDVSDHTVDEIIGAKGKWSYFLDQPIHPGNPLPPLSEPAHVAPPPDLYGAVGQAMQKAGMTAENAIQSKYVIPVTNRWVWAVDKTNMRWSHLFRLNAQATEVRTACGSLPTYPQSKTDRLVASGSTVRCQHCRRIWERFTTAENVPHHQPAEIHQVVPANGSSHEDGKVEVGTPVSMTERRQEKYSSGWPQHKVDAWLLQQLAEGPLDYKLILDRGRVVGLTRNHLQAGKARLDILHRLKGNAQAGSRTSIWYPPGYDMHTGTTTTEPKPTPTPATPTAPPTPTTPDSPAKPDDSVASMLSVLRGMVPGGDLSPYGLYTREQISHTKERNDNIRKHIENLQAGLDLLGSTIGELWAEYE